MSGQLLGPAAVALDVNQNLFIADTFNHRIRMVDVARAGARPTLATLGQ